MKILIFTEGTIIMHDLAKDVNRKERVKQSQEARIQQFVKKILPFKTSLGSVYDLESYVPIGNAVEKLKSWKSQGAEIVYLTSRRIQSEVETIQSVLKKYHFPQCQNLYFRLRGEDYKDIAERLRPDIIIEDDCESIGGEKEMTYPHIKEELKSKIKSIVVKEFEGIERLPDNVKLLKQYE